MTEYFQVIKPPAQDDPITVDQVRLLAQNNHWIKSVHRNMIFAASWQYGTTTGNGVDDGITLPDCIFPKGITSLYVAMCVNNASGAGYTATMTFNILDSFLVGQDYSTTKALGTGVNWIDFVIPLDYGLTYETDAQRGGIYVDVSGTGAGSTYYYDVAFLGLFDEEETVNPKILDRASSLDLRLPASDLNVIGSIPQFLGGWLYAGTGDQITRDAAATPLESFRMFHLHDYADDQLSQDKNYTMGLARYGGATDAAETFNAKCFHLESSSSESISAAPVDTDIIRQEINGVYGESYSVGSGVESVIMGDIWSTGAAADDSRLLGVGFWDFDSTPYTTGRSQGVHRTACDSAYFEALAGRVVDYETIQGLGRAQFNSVYRRAGQTRALLFRESLSLSLTTSFQDLWWFNHFVGDRQEWQTNRKGQGVVTGVICLGFDATGAGDIELQISSGAGGDTDTIGYVYAATTNYLYGTFEIDIDLYTTYGEAFTVEIRDKATSHSIDLWGAWIGFYDITETY